MTTTLTVKSPADVLAVVPVILGFTPEDSLVILGNGGGQPHARVDMPHTAEDVRLTKEGLAPAVPHWVGQRVLVIGYTDDADRFDALDWADLLPGVTVVRAFLASDYEPTPDLPGLDALPKPAACRAALVEEAARITDPESAVRAAWSAYRKGDGARAWTFTDRAVALGADMADLDALLRGAVPPVEGEEVSA